VIRLFVELLSLAIGYYGMFWRVDTCCIRYT